MNTIITRILITGALLFATSAFAADSQPSPQPAPDKFSAVREQNQQVAGGALLRRVVETQAVQQRRA